MDEAIVRDQSVRMLQTASVIINRENGKRQIFSAFHTVHMYLSNLIRTVFSLLGLFTTVAHRHKELSPHGRPSYGRHVLVMAACGARQKSSESKQHLDMFLIPPYCETIKLAVAVSGCHVLHAQHQAVAQCGRHADIFEWQVVQTSSDWVGSKWTHHWMTSGLTQISDMPASSSLSHQLISHPCP